MHLEVWRSGEKKVRAYRSKGCCFAPNLCSLVFSGHGLSNVKLRILECFTLYLRNGQSGNLWSIENFICSLRFIECNIRSFLQTVSSIFLHFPGTGGRSNPSGSGSSCPTESCNSWVGGLDRSTLHARCGTRHHRCAELPRSGGYAHRSADGRTGPAASSPGGFGKSQAGRCCGLCWNQVGCVSLSKVYFFYRTLLFCRCIIFVFLECQN